MTTERGFGGFGVRPRNPSDARAVDYSVFPPEAQARLQGLPEIAAKPFVGVTTGGEPQQGLFGLKPTGIPTTNLVAAANAFLDALSPEQRAQATRPLDSGDWRLWHNAEMYLFRHGVMLESLNDGQREAAYNLFRAGLSAAGFQAVRNIMKLNDFLREITGFDRSLGELLYFVTIFGTPSTAQPWGWQIDGHHLNLSYVVVGDQVVMTPVLMGGEPVYCDRGQYSGISIMDNEQRTGLDLMRALSPKQRQKATLFGSMLSKDLPPERNHRSEGRQWSTAFQDNAVIPYEGIAARELSQGQQDLLLSVVESYVGYMRPGHDRLRMREIEGRLDETHFAWIGGTGDDDVFYYKVHSPLVLIELDMHRGVFLDNDEPQKFHIHTMVRTPNGNDYGKDLLRQHLELHHRTGAK